MNFRLLRFKLDGSKDEKDRTKVQILLASEFSLDVLRYLVLDDVKSNLGPRQRDVPCYLLNFFFFFLCASYLVKNLPKTKHSISACEI